jgi:imidazolonepropionase-like amidohydrolase
LAKRLHFFGGATPSTPHARTLIPMRSGTLLLPVLSAFAALSACRPPKPPDTPPPEPARLSTLEARGLAPVEDAPALSAPPLLLTGAKVMTAAGVTHDPGWVLLRDGRVAELGAGEPPAAPDAKKIDLTGRVITPGLIDTHSHIGVYAAPDAQAHNDGNEMTSPVTAGVWAEHAFWPEDPQLELLVAGGVTTAQILPGSGNLIGGRGVILHLVPTRGARAMRLPGAPETLKMACGENPKRVYGERGSEPSTRMGNLHTQREAFYAAERLVLDWETYTRAHETWAKDGAEGEAPTPPARDLNNETLALVIQGEILPQVHCYRADDMLNMLQLADELGFSIRSFHHALEAYKIRDVLAERDVAVSTWADWWGFKLEAWDGIEANAAMLAQAGVRAVIHSDSPIGAQRLNQEAAKARRAGAEAGITFTDDQTLRWITANPAWALGVEDQVGTLEPGKRADLTIWDGDPFSVYTHAELVIIDGALRYRRGDGAAPWSDWTLGREVAP